MKLKNRIELDSYFPYLLRAISAYIGRGTASTTVRTHGIGMREWRILALMGDRGAVTGKAISIDSGMDKGSVSRALKYLDEHGLICQCATGDWRSKPYDLSAEGARVYEELAASKRARADLLWSNLTKSERRQLISLLQKLKRNVNAVLSDLEQ
ncbi:hypothetical protein MNBD_ALPHA04-2374 [hydrothermal vent metagenome]|uniref:HTH marR-type domain-containing protein n=1 Tax=hydrothermal vent metagenome TaxID=652676 RepID=A0A3B0RPD9_9ZZZZ